MGEMDSDGEGPYSKEANQQVLENNTLTKKKSSTGLVIPHTSIQKPQLSMLAFEFGATKQRSLADLGNFHSVNVQRSGSSSAPPSPTNQRKFTQDHFIERLPLSFHEPIITQYNEQELSVKCSRNESTIGRRRSISDVTHSAYTSCLPSFAPGSPASTALEQANKKAYKGIMDKRMRIGKTKIGRTKYKGSSQHFKRPKGNEINAKHEQYALTFGMMSGILNSVGLQNQFKQHLIMDDFMRVEKRNFTAGSNLKHPFKFKDYSPDIFRQIRRRFNIDSADYMLTLCGDFNYIEFISNSKSGQFFFYSHDGRFMIKTQTKAESKFLRRILPHYYKFAMENPNTLLTRFYGMHRVKMHHLRRKMHFVIMNSVFDTPKDIHLKFDLKGSRIGREATQNERDNNGVLKDLDIINNNIHISVGPEKRAMLLEQLRKDVEFLKRMKIMDYSLLVGIHDQSRHTSSVKKPGETLDFFTADVAKPTTSLSDGELESRSERVKGEIHFAQSHSLSDDDHRNSTTSMAMNHPKNTKQSHDLEYPDWTLLPVAQQDLVEEENSSEEDDPGYTFDPLSPRLLDTEKHPAHTESLFCKDEGGMYGVDKKDELNGCVYFLGIIDILQQYNSKKIAETFLKGFRHSRKQISAVHPNFYGDRFIKFIEEHVLINES